MKNSNAKPPAGLSSEAKKWRKAVLAEFEIDDAAGLALLNQACESLDRLRQIQEILEKDGLTTVDRFGQVRAHPLLPAERDCRTALTRCLRHLNLDVAPALPIGRPPGR